MGLVLNHPSPLPSLTSSGDYRHTFKLNHNEACPHYSAAALPLFCKFLQQGCD